MVATNCDNFFSVFLPVLVPFQISKMNHSAALEKLCRICGNLFKSNKSFLIESYKSDLEKVFYIRFTEDDKNIHPAKFCINCYKRWKNVTNRKTTLNFKVFEWLIHVEDCTVCDLASSLAKGGKKRKDSGAKGRPSCSKTRWTREHSLNLSLKFRDEVSREIFKENICSQLNPHLKFVLCDVSDNVMRNPVRITICDHTFCCDCLLKYIEGQYIYKFYPWFGCCRQKVH